MSLFRRYSKNSLKKSTLNEALQKQVHTEQQVPLYNDIDENLTEFRNIYSSCDDLIFHTFYILDTKAVIIYVEGLANSEEINENVLSPLMNQKSRDVSNISNFISGNIPISNTKKVNTYADCIHHISSGNPVLLLDKQNLGLALGLSKWDKRSINEPISESVIRGPREGFIETLRINTSLLRRKIKSPKLKMQSMQIGKYTKTEVSIAFIDGIADESLITEVKNRLERIEIDGVLESGYIEELIEDNPFSPFPQIFSTERPDTVAACLLEGRVAIFVDGTPFVLIVPITLYSLLQAGDDYYERFLVGTFIRWLRYILLVIALLFPSLYVSVLTYHQEMLPTTLLISIAASREAIPFPALVEAFLMEVTFEALREAGLRLPKQIGSAVSIVGALVIGEAAVSAGLVSAPMVIVVAITGIASFSIPRYSAAIALRILRFPMMFIAGTLGLLGIMMGIIIMVIHLCTLRSFGVPYLSPMAPMKSGEMKDVLIRAPWWSLNKRPHLTGKYNEFRQSAGQKPDPENGEG